jgi:hypothetical protein
MTCASAMQAAIETVELVGSLFLRSGIVEAIVFHECLAALSLVPSGRRLGPDSENAAGSNARFENWRHN